MIPVLWADRMSASGDSYFPAAAHYVRGTTTMEGADSTAWIRGGLKSSNFFSYKIVSLNTEQ